MSVSIYELPLLLLMMMMQLVLRRAMEQIVTFSMPMLCSLAEPPNSAGRKIIFPARSVRRKMQRPRSRNNDRISETGPEVPAHGNILHCLISSFWIAGGVPRESFLRNTVE